MCNYNGSLDNKNAIKTWNSRAIKKNDKNIYKRLKQKHWNKVNITQIIQMIVCTDVFVYLSSSA